MTVGPRSGKLRECIPTTVVIQGTFVANGLFIEVDKAEELQTYLNKYAKSAAEALGTLPPATVIWPKGHVHFEAFENVEVYDSSFTLIQTRMPIQRCAVRAKLQPWARKRDDETVVTLVLRALQVECTDGLL